MNLQILREILLNSFLILVWLGSIASFVLGCCMILIPERAVSMNRRLSKWIDTRRIGAVLDEVHVTERFLYRHHRVVGALIAVGGIYVLNFFLLTNKARNLVATLETDRIGVLDAMISVFVIGSVLAVAIGSLMALKPSLLKEMERSANRWISTEPLHHFFNKSYAGFDTHLLRYRKFSAVFFILAGGFVFVRVGELLLRGTWRFLI